MKNKIFKRIIITLGFSLVFFVLIGGATYYFFYLNLLDQNKLNVLSKLPLPVAKVNKKYIFGSDLVFYQKIYEKISDKQLSTNDILEKVLNNKKTEILSENLNLIATPAQIDFFYTQLQKDEKNTTLLSSYSLNSEEFKEKFLKSFISDNNLKVWFNQQESLHPKDYSLAKNLQSQAFDSEAFSRLALKFSQDKNSSIFGGDFGMKETAELLPEVSDALAKLKINQTTITASSAGLHIIRLESEDLNGHEGTKRYGFKQIFLPLSGFEEWLSSAGQPIESKIYIKFSN